MIYIIPFLSVILGFVAVSLIQPKNKKNIKLLLAFSGSFLLALTVSHLLPEIYEDSFSTVGKPSLFIMVGIVFQIVLEYFSQGAEHGHVHSHKDMKQIPWLLFFSLCLHALMEGMPVSQHNELAWGISIHHFPIAIILTTFLIKSHLNKVQIAIFMLSFALMTPLGTYISTYSNFLVPFQKEITAFVIGILFHISSTIIFESSEGHKFNLAKLIAIVLGIVLAYLM